MGIPSRLHALTIPLLAAVVALAGANSVNYVTALRPSPDAGVFSAVGMQLVEGSILYRDTADAKPPVVYALNALALKLGDGTFHSIRILERVWAVAAVLLVFFIVLTVFKKRSLSAIAAVAFSFYAFSDAIFEEGNVSEEYAVVFVLAGMLCVVRSVVLDKRPSPFLVAGSGLCFASAALTKEPFLFSSVAWFLLLVVRSATDWRLAVRTAVFFALGALIPAGVFLAYLILHGGLSDWIERLVASASFISSLQPQTSFIDRLPLAFEQFETHVLLTSIAGRLAFGVGVLSALVLTAFASRYRFVPCVALLAFVLEFSGATLSPTLYGHYFLQVVPSFVLIASAGGALLLDMFDGAFTSRWQGRVLLALIPCLLDYSAIGEYLTRLQQPFARPEPSGLSAFVRQHAAPNDHLWVSNIADSRFYVETGLTSPTPSMHYFAAWFTDTRRSTSAEKVAQLEHQLDASPPQWVVVSDDTEPLQSIGVLEWVCREYTRTPFIDEGYGAPAYLYVRNDRAAATLAGRSARDPVCAVTFVNRSLEYYQQRDWAKSIDASRRARALDPRNVSAYTNLCAAYVQLEEYDEAIEACDAGLLVAPENQLARNNLRWAQSEKARH